MKFLLPHLGLGDAILLAGAAVTLANRHDGLIFPCYWNNYESVSSFFRPHPHIAVLTVKSETDMIRKSLETDLDKIAVGHYSNSAALPDETFDEWMYRTAGVAFPARWAACPLRLAAHDCPQHTCELNGQPLSFFHEDPTRGFRIASHYKQGMSDFVHPELFEKRSILSFAKILKEAPQIHVINSSFLHLAEILETTGKLHLHAQARAHQEREGFDIPRLRKPWEIVK